MVADKENVLIYMTYEVLYRALVNWIIVGSFSYFYELLVFAADLKPF